MPPIVRVVLGLLAISLIGCDAGPAASTTVDARAPLPTDGAVGGETHDAAPLDSGMGPDAGATCGRCTQYGPVTNLGALAVTALD